MLQIFKNDILANAACTHADLRVLELEFYSKNLCIWGGTATVMAGFVFEQITNPVPKGTDFNLELAYIICQAICLGLSLCVITWTVLCCMWGPGLVLHGPNGIQSFHIVIDFLRSEQSLIYFAFTISIFAWFGSACTLVWVYPSSPLVNTFCMGTLAFFLGLILYLQIKLEFFDLGGSICPHDGPDGQIKAFTAFENLADFDNSLANMTPEGGPTPSYSPSYTPGYSTPYTTGYNTPYTPGYNTPHTPGYNTSGYNTPAYSTRGYNTPGYRSPLYSRTPGNSTPCSPPFSPPGLNRGLK